MVILVVLAVEAFTSKLKVATIVGSAGTLVGGVAAFISIEPAFRVS